MPSKDEDLEKNLARLKKKIGYKFKGNAIFSTALTHKSFGNEHHEALPVSQRDNEQLEFLGDAVLDLAVSELLLEIYPHLPEGELSKLRASLVNEYSLAAIARLLGLGSFLRLGKGEDQTGGREKDSILSSLLEALLAAIYQDGGFPKAKAWVQKHFKEHAIQAGSAGAKADGLHMQDYKTKLQEIAQAKFKVAPRYEVTSASGPDHDKIFVVRVLIKDKELASGAGKSKKEAEQRAAKAVFERHGQQLSDAPLE